MTKTENSFLDLEDGDIIQVCGRSLDGDLLVPNRSVAANAGYQTCVCPHCRRELSMKVTIQEPSILMRPNRAPPVITEHEHGYVAIMYGSAAAYFAGALVTGWSLQQQSSLPISCRVLLCTDDVPDIFKSVLSFVWTIRPVEYIKKASTWLYWDYQNSRFKHVFTKLRVLNDLYGVFKKVILLDLDLLIRGKVDDLFDLNAPAAMVRGQSVLKHGEVVPIDTFFAAHRQVIGINCGVMLVEPNAAVFDHMLEEVEQHIHPEHWPSHGPEQDYLSRYFNAFGQWTNMSCKYNYQCHLTQFGSLEWHHYNIKGHPEVRAFHFSGRLVKPWALVLDLKIAHGFTYDELEAFVHGLFRKAQENLKAYIARGKPTKDDASGEAGYACESHFCYGLGHAQKGTKRCYLDRYVHPSWTEADSDCAVEWIRAFRDVDEALGGRMTKVLMDLWSQERKIQ